MPRMTRMPAMPSSFDCMNAPPPWSCGLPDHPLRSGCGGFVQQFERFTGRRCDEQLRAPPVGEEAALGRVIDEFDQSVPEAFYIEQAKGLGVIAERVPAPRLE